MEYVNPTYLLLWAAALAGILAIGHSVLGERVLIGPAMAYDNGVLSKPLYQKVTRLAWHWTSVLWLLVAAVLVLAAYGDIDAPWLILAIGIAHLAVGLVDLAYTRGKHVTWALIAFVGALVCLANYLSHAAAT